MENNVITKFKVREIDNNNIEYLIPVDAVIKLIAPQDCRIDTIEDNRNEKQGIFHIITQQVYGGLAARTRVIKADKEGWVHIIFNKSIHKLNVETTAKTGLPSRGIIDHLRYMLIVNGSFMEDPVKLHRRVVEYIKTRVSDPKQ